MKQKPKNSIPNSAPKIVTGPPEVEPARPSTFKTATNVARHDELAFGKGNYIFMLIGIGLIVLGYFIMTLDKEEFGFGFLGITLGPIVAILGFIVEFYAIFKRK
ncbi:MAG: DUF3098 domain-containing protein [Leadbetterella sp.]